MSSRALVRLEDQRVMRWKNGLGETREIAVHPPGAALDAFEWRVSVAAIGASGPFSRFPGCDRLLVQLEGAPMTLTHEEGGEARRLERWVPYRFAGEAATYGALDTAPARDFNVIVRRDAVRADLAVRTLLAGERATAGGDAGGVIYLLRGAARWMDGETSPVLAEGDAVVVEDGEATEVTATRADTTVILVDVGRAG